MSGQVISIVQPTPIVNMVVSGTPIVNTIVARGVQGAKGEPGGVETVNGRNGVVTLDKTDVGLGSVDNTSDLDKPVSTATQTALNLKADAADVTASLALKADASTVYTKTETDTALNLKAPLNSPTFTGTVSGVTKSMVGLGSVDNTGDFDKPISTATQTALNLKADAAGVSTALGLKADAANPMFTGKITGDFSNATQSSRLLFQSSTINGFTNVGVIPNGTNTNVAFTGFSSTDATNTSVVQMGVDSVGRGAAWLASNRTGTGTHLPLVFDAGGNERVRITPTGELLHGLSAVPSFSAGGMLNGTGNLATCNLAGTGVASVLAWGGTDSVNAPFIRLRASTTDARVDSGTSGTAAALPLTFYAGGNERVRIATDGNVGVGIEPAVRLDVAGRIRCMQEGSGTSGALTIRQSSGDAYGGVIQFVNNANSVQQGYIQVTPSKVMYVQTADAGGVQLTAGGTAWAAWSDERKKDIIEPITNATEKVSTLRAVIGKYKTDDADKRRSFLIAQDVQAVLPEAVNVDMETGEGVLCLAYTDVIPLLVAAIKELAAEVEALKNVRST